MRLNDPSPPTAPPPAPIQMAISMDGLVSEYTGVTLDIIRTTLVGLFASWGITISTSHILGITVVPISGRRLELKVPLRRRLQSVMERFRGRQIQSSGVLVSILVELPAGVDPAGPEARLADEVDAITTFFAETAQLFVTGIAVEQPGVSGGFPPTPPRGPPPPNPSAPPAAQVAGAVQEAATGLAEILTTVEQVSPEGAQQVTDFVSELIGVQQQSRQTVQDDEEAVVELEAAAESLNNAVLQLARAAVGSADSGTIVLRSPNLNVTTETRRPSELAATPVRCGTSVSERPIQVDIPEDVLSAAAGIFDPSIPVSTVLYTTPGILHALPPSIRRRRRLSDCVCENTCEGMPLWVTDNFCDDGGSGSEFLGCSLGSDCDDCGPRCSDIALPDDDGPEITTSPTVTFSLVQSGSELRISGAEHPINVRVPFPRPIPPSAPECECTNTCEATPLWANDGDCDDGGVGAEYTGCVTGTDCIDCGPRCEDISATINYTHPCIGSPASQPEGTDCSSYVQCQFWNKTAAMWSTDGCVTIRDEAVDGFTCSCDHLTEFIVFEFPSSADDLLAYTLSAVSMNSLSMEAFECAFTGRSWRTVPAIWGCIIFLILFACALLFNAVKNDRKEIRDMLILLAGKKKDEHSKGVGQKKSTISLSNRPSMFSRSATRILPPSKASGKGPEPAQPTSSSPSASLTQDDAVPATDATFRTSRSAISSIAAIAKASSSKEIVGDLVVTPRAQATLGGAKATLRDAGKMVASLRPKQSAKAVPAALHVRPSAANRWKQSRKVVQAEMMATRWNKDVDNVWKRTCLACTTNHTLCAGILYRGAGGLTRAQTCMLLINSFAFELIMLCLTYPQQTMNEDEDVPLMTINPVSIIISATVAALIVIPMMIIFAWLFEPMIFVRLGRWVIRLVCRILYRVLCGPPEKKPEPESKAQDDETETPVELLAPAQTMGVLRVYLYRAVGLKAADWNGKSDPYVKVQRGRVNRRC